MDRPKGPLARFMQHFHSPGDLLLFTRIAVFLAVLPLRLKTRSLSGLMQAITPGISCREDAEIDIALSDRIALYTDYILARGHFCVNNICLKRSMTLYHFLRCAGMDVTLCMGVWQKEGLSADAALQGHAWITRGGVPFLEARPDLTEKCRVTCKFP